MYEALNVSLLIAILMAQLVFVAPKTATPRLILIFLCLTVTGSFVAFLTLLIASGTLDAVDVLQWAVVAGLFGGLFGLTMGYHIKFGSLRSAKAHRAWADARYREYDEQVARENAAKVTHGTEMEPRTPT